MVLVVLRIAAFPGRVMEMIQALRSIIASAQPQEGCAGCHLHVEIGAPASLFYTEEWETEMDLEHQIRSNRFTRLLWVMESASEPPKLEFQFISQTRGLDYVEQVRASADPDGPLTPGGTASLRTSADGSGGTPERPDHSPEA